MLYSYFRTFRFALFTIFFALPLFSIAQAPNWVMSIGGSSDDNSRTCRVSPNGNFLVAGNFSGTIDLDSSAAVHNITSNSGSDDMFLACYTSSGGFLWGFNIGGNSFDAITNMSIDSFNNVYVSGWFRGQNIDFDPSAGIANLSDQGLGGGSPWGGDGFVAKYTPTGAYQWAIDLGGSTTYDDATSLTADAVGNIYVGGTFQGQMDIDPSAATYYLNSAKGELYLVKYNTSGQLQWGFELGSKNVGNNDTREMVADHNGHVFVTGFIQGTNNDMDPSSAVANLASVGSSDAYLAEYDAAGNYMFAFTLGSVGWDEGDGVALDPLGNVYLTGVINTGTIDFDPSSATASLTGSGSNDIFIAKYNNIGQYQWAHMLGGTGNDYGYKVAVMHNTAFFTGYFSNTVDFDPSPAVFNMTSNGNTDVYVAKYDLAGNYLCGFNVGGQFADAGLGIGVDSQSSVYITGQFAGTNVDFDPTSGTVNLSSVGGLDIFYGKYAWSNIAALSGYLTGDTVCKGAQAYLTFSAGSGTGPFTVTYTDGTNIYTQTGVQSGVPFSISSNPTTTTTYSLTNISANADLCASWNGVNQSATVLVRSLPLVSAGPDTLICATNSTYHLAGSGAGASTWTPVWGLDNATILNPLVTFSDSTQLFHLVVTDANGCSNSDSVQIAIHPLPIANAGNDTTICGGVALQLYGSGNGTYSWSPTTGLDNASIANPVLTPVADSISYILTVTSPYGCKSTDTVLIKRYPAPLANAGNDTAVCPGQQFMLHAAGGGTYSWYPATLLSDPQSADPLVSITQDAQFNVVITDTHNCTDTATVKVSIIPAPNFSVNPDKNICIGDSVVLQAQGGDQYVWSPDSTISLGTIENPMVWPSSNTIYTVLITEKTCNRSASLPVSINVHTLPNIQITEAKNIACNIDGGQLEATGATTYSWSPAASLDNPAIANPVAHPIASTLYTVTGTDEYGCKNTDSATIKILYSGKVQIFVPSAFSPNGDGKNDCFKILIPDITTAFELHIYSRWGNLLFSSVNHNDCWDGTFKGVPLELGTYYYYYKIKTEGCGDIEGKGDVELIR